jgi:hypothetical protein
MATASTKKQFPKPKYHFSALLREVGDQLHTEPLTKEGVRKFQHTLDFWSWRKRYTVSTKSYRVAADKWEVEATLEAKHRHREYI